MHKLETVIGFVFNKIFLSSLVVVILILVPVLTLSSTVTNKENVKTWLLEGDIYNTVPDNIIDIIELETTSNNQSSMNNQTNSQTFREILNDNGLLDPDQLITTFRKSLDSQFLRTQVEGLTDSVYG